MINVLAALLRDTSPQIIKRVIQSCSSIYRNTLAWMITLADISDTTERAWNTLCIMKGEILDMIDHDNEGIRTNAIKFLEGAVILQTYADKDSMKRENDFSLENIPYTVKLIRRRKLEDEAMNIFDVLLKFHSATHISSVNLIACTGTLCIIAKMRPRLMAPVIEAMKNVLSNLPPTLTDSQVSSVRKHFKMQLINILKQPSAYEYQSTITMLLQDLGASNQEISRSIPKLTKHEQHIRAKRALENATAAAAAKRIKLERDAKEKPTAVPIKRQMEIDYDEIEEQIRKSNRINEQFLTDHLKSIDTAVELVMLSMIQLPNEFPASFAKNYTSIVNLTHAQTIEKISQNLAVMMTDKRIGPGATAITKEPPMRVKVSLEEEKSIILSMRKEPPPVLTMEIDETADGGDRNDGSGGGGGEGADGGGDDDTITSRKEEATKKLRENMERSKSGVEQQQQQNSLQRMKQQRTKTLKFQEITKPLSRIAKEKFLADSVGRVLRAERQAIVGGVALQRRKVLTVLAATFTNSVRETIIKFILADIKNRLDLAFTWLYEEYSLLQGFTRHSYIKTEQKPDFAYNKLLGELITSLIDNQSTVGHDNEKILRKIYMEAPIISDEAFDHLVMMCELADLSDCAMELLKDLAILRPPKRTKFVDTLLKYTVHDNVVIREKANANVFLLYAEHKIMVDKIEEHSLKWLQYLEKTEPPAEMFSIEYGRSEAIPMWNEQLAKVCLSLFFNLLPHHEQLVQKLCSVYIGTTSEMKRIILRAIEMPIKKMGAESVEILNLIETCPKGSETLITRIIYILTEKTAPHPELVKYVRELYQTKVSDVRLLIPVINGLSKQEIIAALPKLLKLNPAVVKEVFTRLLGLGKDIDPKSLAMSASELLVALHTLDTTKVELKFVVKATSLCLAEKDCFTQDILAIVLQQLIEITPLPTLVMRTIIQSLTLYPKLSGFVTNLLQRLIPKQVWKQKVVWDGYLKCCQRLKPNSLPVLMTLPPPQLIEALNTCPDLRQPMIDHANGIIETQGGSVSKITMDILLGNNLDLFITVRIFSSGFIAVLLFMFFYFVNIGNYWFSGIWLHFTAKY